MAAQKGTVERLRQSGVGALSNAFGMAALPGAGGEDGALALVGFLFEWIHVLSFSHQKSFQTTTTDHKFICIKQQTTIEHHQPPLSIVSHMNRMDVCQK